MSAFFRLLFFDNTRPTETFPHVGALAARIHELRQGRAIKLRPIALTEGDTGRKFASTASGIMITTPSEADPLLGAAIIGEPPLSSSAQEAMLKAALAKAQEPAR